MTTKESKAPRVQEKRLVGTVLTENGSDQRQADRCKQGRTKEEVKKEVTGRRDNEVVRLIVRG